MRTFSIAPEARSLHPTREREADLIARRACLGPPDRLPRTSLELPSSANGAALPEHVREHFEPRLGFDLSTVRVHVGGPRAALARDLGAHAFAQNADITFRSAAALTASRLAHEVGHVVQQARGDAPRGAIQCDLSEDEVASRYEALNAEWNAAETTPARRAELEHQMAVYRAYRSGGSSIATPPPAHARPEPLHTPAPRAAPAQEAPRTPVGLLDDPEIEAQLERWGYPRTDIPLPTTSFEDAMAPAAGWEPIYHETAAIRGRRLKLGYVRKERDGIRVVDRDGATVRVIDTRRTWKDRALDAFALTGIGAMVLQPIRYAKVLGMLAQADWKGLGQEALMAVPGYAPGVTLGQAPRKVDDAMRRLAHSQGAAESLGALTDFALVEAESGLATYSLATTVLGPGMSQKPGSEGPQRHGFVSGLETPTLGPLTTHVPPGSGTWSAGMMRRPGSSTPFPRTSSVGALPYTALEPLPTIAPRRSGPTLASRAGHWFGDMLLTPAWWFLGAGGPGGGRVTRSRRPRAPPEATLTLRITDEMNATQVQQKAFALNQAAQRRELTRVAEVPERLKVSTSKENQANSRTRSRGFEYTGAPVQVSNEYRYRVLDRLHERMRRAQVDGQPPYWQTPEWRARFDWWRQAQGDHIIDLQLGGRDILGNIRLVDARTNNLLGVQIRQQLRVLEPGTKITRIVVVDERTRR